MSQRSGMLSRLMNRKRSMKRSQSLGYTTYSFHVFLFLSVKLDDDYFYLMEML
jgi:hypothetical protein